MKNLFKLGLALAIPLLFAGIVHAEKAQSGKLKVLLIAGGCCHDYPTQTALLKSGIEGRLNAEVTVILNEDKSTKATFDIYQSVDWAKGYDVVLHDECSANVTEAAYIKRILDAHRSGTPAVNLHCAMHSYRSGNFQAPVEKGADNAAWFEMIGLQSSGHGPRAPITLENIAPDHPITKNFGGWTTGDEELYNNIKIFEGTTKLISAKQTTPPRKKELKANPNAKPKETTAVIAWAKEYDPKKTRIFSTSLGHTNETVADSRYLDLLVRGLLWTTGNISDDGEPAAGLIK